ncbi:hypothetical protein ABL78_7526 [Leptomonas seymouri]|uniref:Vacuolar sorting protein 39/Transforming growth factor beta receptor-associated zinc finger domain-containing protein n=1 Tax=Leptomonas seymouri TaxID=5684 RepID=A0A0N1IH25_LEPSE|nr:hypothetical protein ABL78_7526 [Leptomonas seymouri]|eukprot:KPI83440.1 hypothetical protein ABL78_7526 [Leptomonas seymouri]
MDSKILYTNDRAEVQCVAVKSIKTVKGSTDAARDDRLPPSTEPQGIPLPSSDTAIFLLPHESLYSYLYIGTADGFLLALRFQIFLQELAVPGGGLIYEHRVALHAQSKLEITVPHPSVSSSNGGSRARSGSGQEGMSASPMTTASTPLEPAATDAAESSTNAAVRGVRAMEAPMSLPYVFLHVHGRFEVREDDTLQPLDRAYTAPLRLGDSTVLFMCTGEEQTTASRQRRPPSSSVNRGTSTSQGATGKPDAEADLSSAVAYYALLLDNWMVMLVGCTKASSTRLAFLDSAGEATGSSKADVKGAQHASSLSPLAQQQGFSTQETHVPNTLLPVLPNTSTMAWCGDVLITGSPSYYRLYDTLHGTVLSQLEVRSLLGSCPPYTAYIRNAAVDPTRAGFDLATEAAEVCSYSGGGSSRSSSSSESSDNDLTSTSGSAPCEMSAREGGPPTGVGSPTGWSSALAFRLRDGELHVCAATGSRADLNTAVPLAGTFGAVREVYSCSPFLMCLLGSGGSDDEGLGDPPAASRLPLTSSGIRTSIVEPRSSSPPPRSEVILFSCLDGLLWVPPEVEPVSFMSVSLRGVRAFPLGLLGFSRHTVEALLWKPFALQLEDQIEAGRYSRVLRFVSQCFRGSESARRVVVRRVCQASATRAMSHCHYRVAFYFYTLAETCAEGLLQLFPELQRPASIAQVGAQRRGADASRDGSRSHTEGGEHIAYRSPVAATSEDRHAADAERQPHPFSYPQHAPYRALYRILISQFFSLVSVAARNTHFPLEDPAATAGATVNGAGEALLRGSTMLATAAVALGSASPGPAPPSPPAADAESAAFPERVAATPRAAVVEMTAALKSQTAAPTGTLQGTRNPSRPDAPLLASVEASSESLERTRAKIEFALFCLFAIDSAGARRLRTTRAELLQFMIFAQTLTPHDGAAVFSALGLPPQFLLNTMLLAARGDYDRAFTHCQEEGDVATAGALLAMHACTPGATDAQLEKLYQQHLPWMLEVDPPTTVQLLTTPAWLEGERPGPEVLLPILLTVGGTVLLDYLSYLINTECSVEPSVHQLYATHLVSTLQTLRDEWGLQGFTSVELGAADGAGTETGLVGPIRRTLLSFLQCSPYYDKERVLAVLVEAGLCEEQCVVLEALGDHVGVLSVHVYAMHDMNRAVRYCEAHYRPGCASAHRWLPLADLRHQMTAAPGSSTQAVSPPKAAGCADGGPLRQLEGLESCRPLPADDPWTHALGGCSANETVSSCAVVQGTLGDATALSFSSSPAPNLRSSNGADGAVDVLMFPSRDCQRVAFNDAAAMAYDSYEPTGDAHGVSGKAGYSESPMATASQIVMHFNPYLHILFHVLLFPPAGSDVALSEIVWLLNTHYAFINPRLVLLSLPGDVPLSFIAPYLMRAFQRLEVNHQLVCMESAAVQSALADAVRHHVSLQQRLVWMDDHRRCVVCGQLLEKGGLVAVFPNLKPAHFRCQQDSTLDPERAVPFFSNTA